MGKALQTVSSAPLATKIAGVFALALSLAMSWSMKAHAAASTVTGIDYKADLVDPVKGELTLGIVAILGLVVMLLAVKKAVGFVRSFAR